MYINNRKNLAALTLTLLRMITIRKVEIGHTIIKTHNRIARVNHNTVIPIVILLSFFFGFQQAASIVPNIPLLLSRVEVRSVPRLDKAAIDSSPP